jgi:hypothetical protein
MGVVQRGETHIPALDPVIQQAFWGYCTAVDWPFRRMIPLGTDRCPHCGETLPKVAVEVRARAAATAAAGGQLRVEFFYGSKDRPSEQFFSDVETTLDLLEKLAKSGVEVKTVDLSTFQGDLFPIYNAAVTGPEAARRAVFGAKGALQEEFGRAVPALLVFGGGGNYPTEVFPRMDRQKNRLVPCEEAAEDLLNSTRRL